MVGDRIYWGYLYGLINSFLKDMNVLSVNAKMLIKMENLMVDKDIFARDVDVLLMSSLYLHFQALN